MTLLSDRESLEQRLAAAEQHVARGLEYICHQKEIIAQLERDPPPNHGPDLEQARAILETFLQTQVLHVEERDRLRAELLKGGSRLGQAE